jgi:2-polyprenyl-6-hydroxyphenyl methylase/3-demethylubiquinone-9 3-methyltransferase
VRSLARPRPTDVVLDVGCGNGDHLLALGPELDRGIGIDISPGMIELARAAGCCPDPPGLVDGGRAHLSTC